MDIKDGLGYLNQTERELLHFDIHGAYTEGFPLRFLRERIKNRLDEEIAGLENLRADIDRVEATADTEDNRYRLYEAVVLGGMTMETLIDLDTTLQAADNPDQL